MHIKRFEADTLKEALKRVREALGPDALVLETRKVGSGRSRFGLAARTRVEVVAASERAAPVEPQGPSRRAAREPSRRPAANESWGGLRLSRALIAPLEEEMREIRRLVERAQARSGHPAAEGSIAEELAELRRLARDLRSPGVLPGSETLVSAGLAPRHAAAFAERRAREPGTDAEGWLATRLESRTRPPRCDESGPLMLVGATGVGKTTTIAKLAGGAGSLPHAVLSTDVHRLGSDESLQAVSRTLGIAFDRAEGPGRLERLLRPHGSAPVLVDTSGVGREEPDLCDELLRLRESLGSRGRVQVVLSASTKEADLRAELARFRDLEPEGCIVTRMDESAEISNVVNVLLDDDAPPLTWVGNGRCIPDDLAAAQPAGLARRMLGASACA